MNKPNLKFLLFVHCNGLHCNRYLGYHVMFLSGDLLANCFSKTFVNIIKILQHYLIISTFLKSYINKMVCQVILLPQSFGLQVNDSEVVVPFQYIPIWHGIQCS